MRAARLFLVVLAMAVAAPALGAPLIVVPMGAAGDPDAPRLAAELALRCPSARTVPFTMVKSAVPRFSDPAAPAGPEGPPEELAALKASFYHSDDAPGLAVRFTRLARSMEEDPVALLASPARRTGLREAYLFAARALLQAGDGAGAQAQLVASALRFGGLPEISDGEWGPAMRAAAEQGQKKLPAALHLLVVEGPAGWAVHIDEQPAGALPLLEVRLTPGRHAVVVVGSEGTRASWLLDLPWMGSQRLHLVADRRLRDLCGIGGTAGLCGSARPPENWPALAQLLEGELLLLRRQQGQLFGWRLRRGVEEPGQNAAASLTVTSHAVVSLLAGEAEAVTTLARRLCPPPPPPLRPALAPLSVAALARAKDRAPLWPGVALLSVGAIVGAAAVPYFVYDGRCIESDCARVYDFHAVAPSLAGIGAALAIGGAVWIGFVLR